MLWQSFQKKKIPTPSSMTNSAGISNSSMKCVSVQVNKNIVGNRWNPTVGSELLEGGGGGGEVRLSIFLKDIT